MSWICSFKHKGIPWSHLIVATLKPIRNWPFFCQLHVWLDFLSPEKGGVLRRIYRVGWVGAQLAAALQAIP